MKIYFDTSAIIKLYYPELESEKLSKWTIENQIVIALSHFHRLEINNAFALKVFRREITTEQYDGLMECLAADRVSGIFKDLHADWDRIFNKGVEIAGRHTRNFGNRSLDIMHVALAMETGHEKMVTFDNRQVELAKANGLEVIDLANE